MGTAFILSGNSEFRMHRVCPAAWSQWWQYGARTGFRIGLLSTGTEFGCCLSTKHVPRLRRIFPLPPQPLSFAMNLRILVSEPGSLSRKIHSLSSHCLLQTDGAMAQSTEHLTALVLTLPTGNSGAKSSPPNVFKMSVLVASI